MARGAGSSINRRTFLRRTLAGAALLALGGTLGRNLSGYRLDPALAGALRALSAKEALVLLAVARRILAPDDGTPPPPPLDEPALLRAVDGYLLALPEAVADDVRALLQLVEHSPILFDLRASRFTHLAPAAQDAVLAGWQRSRLDVRRQGFAALKSLAMIGRYGDPRTFALLGYVPAGGP